MSHRVLSAQLFHGSQHDLVGDTLRPNVRQGQGNVPEMPGGPWARHGQSTNEIVSATPHESVAWEVGSYGTGRARVHIVEPHPEQRIGIENKDHPDFHKPPGIYHPVTGANVGPDNRPDHGEIVAPSFRVKETLDIMPGRQGTFPGINWIDHAGRRPSFDRYEASQGKTYPMLSAHEANHPSWDQVNRTGPYAPEQDTPRSLSWMQTPAERAHHAAQEAEKRGQLGFFPHPEPKPEPGDDLW